jgi:hypothetical protein
MMPVGHVELPLHEGSSVLGSWPGQRTHVVPPHVLPPHAVLFTQRLQTFGSPMLAAVQFGETSGLMSTSAHVAPLQIVQQPKQSQPGGASGAHTSMHCCGTGVWPNGS